MTTTLHPLTDHSHLEAAPTRVRLGEYLLSKGLITADMLHAARQEQIITQDKLGMILVRDGFLTRKDLIKSILEINPEQIQGEATFTARVPGEVLLETQTMVVAETADKVFLATLSSEKQSELDLKPFYPDLQIEFVAGNFEQVDNYLEDVRAMLHDNDSLVDKLLRRAFSEGVSDVHIVPRYSSYTVFYRKLGVRKHVHEGSLEEYNSLSARVKDLSKMDLAERRIPQDGGFQMEYNGKLVDLRVATVPTGSMEYVVIRLLDPDRVQPSLNGLGITRVAQWRMGTSRPDGLCLICGPTGSGKTTTLNATLKEMDRFSNSIFTLEDPVEYRIPYIGQVNTNPILGLDFARGIRAFMRSDPDVIVVGEIRDAETARNAIKAAETGHLVLGTLHTATIFGAIQRLRDLEVPANELVYLLRSVLVQRLIRTTCTHCNGQGRIWGVECKVCSGTGYAAREIVSECEYFPGEDDVRKMLNAERSWPTMLEDSFGKFKDNITDEKEVRRVFGEEARVLFEREKAKGGD